MCGVIRTNSSDSELVVAPQEPSAGMPPSITVGGAEPSKATSPPTEVLHHSLQSQAVAPNREIPTIDLAADENDDLQKAIELSLQEQPEQTPLPGLTAEEQDVSKALEVSLQDTSSITTIDIINPQDRKRIDGIPVGLKNIGNSCWFNVVIQPLYFISRFRDMIINYPKDIIEDENFSKTPAKRYIPALRHLFSLLIASDRKYIDPTEAVKLFQGQEMRKNTQQDVCEFVHKLLEKLEEEFKLLLKTQGIEKESSESSISKDSDFENPIVKLFYGQFKKESVESLEETKLETFGQYPLHVKKYKDIHESILASMSGGVSEDSNKINIKPTEQALWFKTLPSVLIFSLSRFEYSKEKKRAEKVHNKFDFPEYLYMDRYMEINKDIVEDKRIKIEKIKEELNSLYGILEKYQKFGSGETKYPIADILKYALEFAGNVVAKCEESSPSGQSFMEVDVAELTELDVEMAESKDLKSNEDNDGNNESSLREPMNSQPKSASADEIRLCQERFAQISPNKKIRLVPPAPQTVYSGELSVLQACLPRWQKEVELQVDILKKSIEDLECQLAQMFEEPALHHIPYKLHAVVVHEGQASVGHYWVYIFDNFKNVWMKFNDIQVTESSWNELLQDSIGGQNNASAYCLMYIDQTRHNFLFANQKLNTTNLSAHLPLDLQEYVKQDNLLFMSELEEWDAKQESNVPLTNNESDARAVPATAPNSPDIFNMEEENTNFFFEIQTMLSQILQKKLQNEEIILQEKNKSQWLLSSINFEIERVTHWAIERMCEGHYSEPSILDLGIYLSKNNEKNVLLHWYAFEIVWHVTQDRNSKAMLMIRQEAFKFLQQIREKHSISLGSLYQGWKKHYQNLVTCAWHFICGFKKLRANHYEEALLHMVHALSLHQIIKDTPPFGKAKNLDLRVLKCCHRKCLQVVNDKLADDFLAVDTESKAMDIVQTVSTLVVPAMWFLNNSENSEDEIAGNSVRHRWCQVLEVVSPNKALLIKQIIELVTSDECVEFKLPIKIQSVPPVSGLYKEYKDSATILMSSCEKNDSQTSDL